MQILMLYRSITGEDEPSIWPSATARRWRLYAGVLVTAHFHLMMSGQVDADNDASASALIAKIDLMIIAEVVRQAAVETRCGART